MNTFKRKIGEVHRDLAAYEDGQSFNRVLQFRVLRNTKPKALQRPGNSRSDGNSMGSDLETYRSATHCNLSL